MENYMYRIRKLVTMEFAHALDSSYTMGCQRIHGHSYELEVFLKSETLNDDGMIVDFKYLKEVIQKEVIELFDHRFVVSTPYATEYADALLALVKSGTTTTVVDYNPTAENMVRDIYYRLNAHLSAIYKVRLHETRTGYAEYEE
jgi:6-pyruvoyltetrahydropterin/6-carboxytetrahydropterin synthase